MSITGFLTDFSLAEIFQFIEKGHKSGSLTIRTLPEAQTPPSEHYLWVNQGKIVAAAHQLNESGLILLIDRYPWISNRVITKLAQFCPPNKPLGLYLRSQGALQIEHLEHLFQIQIVQEMCALFQLKDAHFDFDQNAALPTQEMTGLSVSAAILGAMLQKLKILKKLFASKGLSLEGKGSSYPAENFCKQLILSLDTAFFHSLNISLFDPDNSLTKVYQVVELYTRPYDLPKSIKHQVMCSTR